jgi:hypothetical protein
MSASVLVEAQVKVRLRVIVEDADKGLGRAEAVLMSGRFIAGETSKGNWLVRLLRAMVPDVGMPIREVTSVMLVESAYTGGE